jgi:archaellum component FlaC
MEKRQRPLNKMQKLEKTISKLQDTVKSLRAKKEAVDAKVERLTLITATLRENVTVLKEIRERREALLAWCKERGAPKNLNAEDRQTRRQRENQIKALMEKAKEIQEEVDKLEQGLRVAEAND